jgi:hypothetical protein
MASVHCGRGLMADEQRLREIEMVFQVIGKIEKLI